MYKNNNRFKNLKIKIKKRGNLKKKKGKQYKTAKAQCRGRGL